MTDWTQQLQQVRQLDPQAKIISSNKRFKLHTNLIGVEYGDGSTPSQAVEEFWVKAVDCGLFDGLPSHTEPTEAKRSIFDIPARPVPAFIPDKPKEEESLIDVYHQYQAAQAQMQKSKSSSSGFRLGAVIGIVGETFLQFRKHRRKELAELHREDPKYHG